MRVIAVLTGVVLSCALLAAPEALARGVQIDPDGLSWWDQFVAWLTGGNTLDPWG